MRGRTVLQRSHRCQYRRVQDSAVVIQADHIDVHNPDSLSGLNNEGREGEDVGAVGWKA